MFSKVRLLENYFTRKQKTIDRQRPHLIHFMHAPTTQTQSLEGSFYQCLPVAVIMYKMWAK